MYGFLAAVQEEIKAMQDPGTQAVMQFVFEKGVAALTSSEIAEKSRKWLQETVVPAYVKHLRNKKDQMSKTFLENLYAADHIRCIM